MKIVSKHRGHQIVQGEFLIFRLYEAFIPQEQFTGHALVIGVDKQRSFPTRRQTLRDSDSVRGFRDSPFQIQKQN